MELNLHDIQAVPGVIGTRPAVNYSSHQHAEASCSARCLSRQAVPSLHRPARRDVRSQAFPLSADTAAIASVTQAAWLAALGMGAFWVYSELSGQVSYPLFASASEHGCHATPLS